MIQRHLIIQNGRGDRNFQKSFFVSNMFYDRIHFKLILVIFIFNKNECAVFSANGFSFSITAMFEGSWAIEHGKLLDQHNIY